MNKSLFAMNDIVTGSNTSKVRSVSHEVLPNQESLTEPGLIPKVAYNLEDIITQLRKIDCDLDLLYGNIFIDPNSPSPVCPSNVCDKQESLSLDKKILNNFDTINTYLKYISGTILKLQTSL